jgi:RTA1 like protein
MGNNRQQNWLLRHSLPWRCKCMSFRSCRKAANWFQSFSPSIVAVACYMVLARLIWFVAPHDQRGSEKLGISLPHFTLISATLELLSLILVFVGGLILIQNGRYGDESYWYRKADTSFRVLIAGLVLQLLVRFYLFCVGLQVSSLRKNWKPTTPKMRFGPRTSIVNMNVCGALLTVKVIETGFQIHTNKP